MVRDGKKTRFRVDSDGELWCGDHLCVPKVDDLPRLILEEAYNTTYTIHLVSTKMYQDLKHMYWRERMKKDVAEFVLRCLVCQQVKAEHQRPVRLLQRIEIPDWKWERITMDFVTGLPRSRKGYDFVWVIVDRLTKSAHFLLDSVNKVHLIRDKLLATQSRYKAYIDHRRRDLEFTVGDHVFLRVSPMKGVMRFGMRGKLNPRYIGPFEVLERVGAVAYRLALSPYLSSVHLVFHVSML
ncbi:uncharacterized protein LOC120005947 [Tripterygium wilfordii]|uniref:uncharacterized protein LOC120005947 n=1 Tax=Tripterygium wilfordii TaxID=458696 RepID=UPI0018F8554B|nr:uncharacterized protein LOC120005947 [Tripterygium wilfordii]